MTLDPKTHRRIAWAGLAVAAIIYVIAAIHDRPPVQVDFHIYDFCAQTYGADPSPYARDDFRTLCFYPPASNYLIGPCMAGGGVAWILITAGAAALSLLLALRLVAAPPVVIVSVIVFFMSDPFTDAAAVGNLSPVIALLVFAALLALRRDLGIVAGLLLGLAAVLKLYPVYLAGWLLVAGLVHRRRPLEIAGGLGISIFAAAQLAPHSADFWRFMAGGDFAAMVIGRGTNNSLPALCDRIGLSVSPVLLLVLCGLPVAWRVLRHPTTIAVDASLVLIVVLLTAPVVWPHTYTLMTLPLLVVARDLAPTRHLHMLGFVFCMLVFMRAEHFSVGSDAVGTLGLVLAVAAPIVLAALLWRSRHADV